MLTEGIFSRQLGSPAGSLVTTTAVEQLDSVEDTALNIMDCRTSASHRVVVSTFGAETSAALEAHGVINDTRAMFAEVEYGHLYTSVYEYGERRTNTLTLTDRKPLLWSPPQRRPSARWQAHSDRDRSLARIRRSRSRSTRRQAHEGNCRARQDEAPRAEGGDW